MKLTRHWGGEEGRNAIEEWINQVASNILEYSRIFSNISLASNRSTIYHRSGNLQEWVFFSRVHALSVGPSVAEASEHATYGDWPSYFKIIQDALYGADELCRRGNLSVLFFAEFTEHIISFCILRSS